jgi:hypothetical protein
MAARRARVWVVEWQDQDKPDRWEPVSAYCNREGAERHIELTDGAAIRRIAIYERTRAIAGDALAELDRHTRVTPLEREP